MRQATRLLLSSLALALAACQATPTTKPSPRPASPAAPTAISSPATVKAEAGASPAPILRVPMPSRVAPPLPKGLLAAQSLSLLGDDAKSLLSVADGGLISDQGGAFNDLGGGIISNNAGAIIGNNAGALIANNGGALISNHGGGFAPQGVAALGAWMPSLPRGPRYRLQDAASDLAKALATQLVNSLIFGKGAEAPTPESSLGGLSQGYAPFTSLANAFMTELASHKYPLGVVVPLRMRFRFMGQETPETLMNAVAIGTMEKPILRIHGVDGDDMDKPLATHPLVATIELEGQHLGRGRLVLRPDLSKVLPLKMVFASSFDLEAGTAECESLYTGPNTTPPYEVSRYRWAFRRDPLGNITSATTAFSAAPQVGRYNRRRYALAAKPDGSGVLGLASQDLRSDGEASGPYRTVVGLDGSLGEGPAPFAFAELKPTGRVDSGPDPALAPADPPNPFALDPFTQDPSLASPAGATPPTLMPKALP